MTDANNRADPNRKISGQDNQEAPDRGDALAPRHEAEAHTHSEPNTERLARGGPHPEEQPEGQQGSNPDEAMAGDQGQTRQPQGSGMVQPDGGVNSPGAKDRG